MFGNDDDDDDVRNKSDCCEHQIHGPIFLLFMIRVEDWLVVLSNMFYFHSLKLGK